MMEAGALDLLLLAMSTHPGSSRVQGSVVGAVLALALGNKTNMLRMETEGALRAVRASMFAYPNMSFAGFYKELQPWLKSQQDDLETYMLMPPEEDGFHQGHVLEDDDSSMLSGSEVSALSSLESFVSGAQGLQGQAHAAHSVARSGSRRSTPERRSALPAGLGLGHMGDWHPVDLVSSLVTAPVPLYKACKGSKLTMSNIKKAYMWATPDGRALNYSYKKPSSSGRLPPAHRDVPSHTVAGLRTGHVTPRLQQQAPKGSEDRCLTLVMEDYKCLSFVFHNSMEMRQCMAATGLVALVAHSQACFSTEERVDRLHALAGVQLPPAVVACEAALDKSLLQTRCSCTVQCGGRYCAEALDQVLQMAQANAEQARRVDSLRRVERGREHVAQVQAKLAMSKRSGASMSEEERTSLQREFDAAQASVQRAQEILDSLPSFAGSASDESAPALPPSRHNSLDIDLYDPDPGAQEAQNMHVNKLVVQLDSPDDYVVQYAVEELRDVTAPKENSSVRVAVVAAGAVEKMCELMGRECAVVAAHAARVVAHLARSKGYHDQINSAGALPKLQSLLHYGLHTRNSMGDEAVASAAMALVNLCSGASETRTWVVKYGGMHSVVQLLALGYPDEPSDEALGNTLALFRSLVSTWTPEDGFSLEQAEHTVPSLVDFISQGAGCDENGRSHHINAAWVLSSLARTSSRFQDVIRHYGGLKPLVQMLYSPDIKTIAAAVAALANLVAGSVTNQKMLREAHVLGVLTRSISEYQGQPVARNALKAMQALATVLGPESRKALKELEATARAVCNPEQRLGLWLRLELKVWLGTRMAE